jgi:hypothetical protein
VVPPHCRDKVSPDKLQPQQWVEPGCFVPCWKERKKQVKSEVLRDGRPKRRKMEQPLLSKIKLTEKKKGSGGKKMTRTRLGGCTGLKIKT